MVIEMNAQQGKQPGKVYLIGAGPGAADLITVRGARLLGEAQVVLHDALGRQVWSHEWDIVNGGDYLVVPVDRLAGGVYWLSVRQGSKQLAVKKILK